MTMVIITTTTRMWDDQVYHHLLQLDIIQEDTIPVEDITQAAVITRVVIRPESG